METRTFWSRVGHWFRPVPARENADVGLSTTDGDGLLKSVTKPLNGNGSRGLFHWPGGNRSASLRRLERGYDGLGEVTDSIRRHLEAQDHRSRQMADTLAQLARTVAELPGLANAQREQLGTLVEQHESSNARLARWESTVEKIPELAEAQRAALQTVGTQFEAARQTHERMVQSTNEFTGAVRSMERSYGRSTEVLKEMHQSAVVRDGRLADLLAEHNRGMTRLWVGAIVLAASLGAATAALLMVR